MESGHMCGRGVPTCLVLVVRNSPHVCFHRFNPDKSPYNGNLTSPYPIYITRQANTSVTSLSGRVTGDIQVLTV